MPEGRGKLHGHFHGDVATRTFKVTPTTKTRTWYKVSDADSWDPAEECFLAPGDFCTNHKKLFTKYGITHYRCLGHGPGSATPAVSPRRPRRDIDEQDGEVETAEELPTTDPRTVTPVEEPRVAFAAAEPSGLSRGFPDAEGLTDPIDTLLWRRAGGSADSTGPISWQLAAGTTVDQNNVTSVSLPEGTFDLL